MPKILKVNRPADFIEYVGAESVNPLVGVVEFEKVSPLPSSLNDWGVYGLFMHSRVRDDLTYGLGGYGSSGSLICVAPGQIGGREDMGDLIDLDGWGLLFHPDLLVGTLLEKEMHQFTFFDYSANEALVLERREWEMIDRLMRDIRDETARPADGDQRDILVGLISVMLHHCNRAYNRQFNRLRQTSGDILVRFSALINEYYADNERPASLGLPTVQYFADRMNMTANYFSDMLKKTTGETAGNFLRNQIVRIAKNRLVATRNIAQVAYSLGFEYPQHFTRMFRRHTGMTPTQFLREGM